MTNLGWRGGGAFRIVMGACACAALAFCGGTASPGSDDAGGGGGSGSSGGTGSSGGAGGSGGAASSGGTGGSGGGGSSGGSATCGSADVPDGGACTSLVDVGPTVTGTCDATGTLPVGTGGTIADGTYVLTSQTYYGSTTCPNGQLSATLVIAGDCWEESVSAGTSSGPVAFTATFTVVVQGNQVTRTSTCLSAGLTASSPSSSSTFTASGGMLMVFTPTTASSPDSTNVFVRQ